MGAFRHLFTGVVFGIVMLSHTAVADESEFIRTLADSAIDVMADRSVTLEQREERFRGLLQDSFAMRRIGRFVVGRYWKDMTPDQQAEYQELFAAWVLNTYSVRLGGYSGQEFVIDGTVEAGSHDRYVRTRIVQQDMAPLRCDWRVREFDEEYRVIDVVVEGISMLSTQRSEFTAMLRKHGPEGLIEAMQARLTRFPATS